ncbi:hypothetical protein PTMSG1_02221 [Pyrenophora teres f. maculata]|nr:hypothetical protein PTMSG1_02221 [Pyrenophora teres f. maculata]
MMHRSPYLKTSSPDPPEDNTPKPLPPAYEVCKNCKLSPLHETNDCNATLKSFPKFLTLPTEIRQLIYSFALRADGPIMPLLCHTSTGTHVKFHHNDPLPANHGSISALLGVTRASKQLHSESFPIFYSANTFFVYTDTMTYFSRLEYLGRLHLVRHVQFHMNLVEVHRVPGMLRRMNTFLKEADAFERRLGEGRHVGESAETLRAHPQWFFCGLGHLNSLITLRKLAEVREEEEEGTTATTMAGRASTTPNLRVVLPLPSSALQAHPNLTYFPLILPSLGISLHTVSTLPNCTPNSVYATYTHNHPSPISTYTWHQLYQKKNFAPSTTPYVSPLGPDGQTVAYRSALALNPQLEQESRPRKWVFSRSGCGGDLLEWVDVWTEGGGIEGDAW